MHIILMMMMITMMIMTTVAVVVVVVMMIAWYRTKCCFAYQSSCCFDTLTWDLAFVFSECYWSDDDNVMMIMAMIVMMTMITYVMVTILLWCWWLWWWQWWWFWETEFKKCCLLVPELSMHKPKLILIRLLTVWFVLFVGCRSRQNESKSSR